MKGFRLAVLAVVVASLILLHPDRAQAGRGGPDGGGWVWLDSDEPGVMAQVQSVAAPISIATPLAKDAVYAVPLPFPFTLYGTTSSVVYLSSNGWVSLLDPAGNSAPTTSPIPGAGIPNALIAYGWGNLAAGGSTYAYHGSIATGYAILVSHVTATGGTGAACAIEFNRDGSLKVVYQTPPPRSTTTIGIEDGTGSNGTQLLRNGVAAPGFNVRAAYAVLFHRDATPACASATSMTCGNRINDDTGRGAATVATYGCSTQAHTGRELVYRLDLPTSQAVTLTLTPAGGRLQSLFLLRARCNGIVDCIAGGATSINLPLLGKGTYYVVVDSRSPSDEGTFTLNSTCTSRGTSITCGQTLSGNATGASLVDTYSCATLAYSGSEAIYDFSLGQPTTIAATLTSALPFDLMLVPSEGLAAGASQCRTFGDTELGVINLPAGNWSLVVDGPGLTSGAFSLGLQCPPSLPSVPINCGDRNVPGSNVGPNYMQSYGCIAITYPYGEAYYRFQPTQRVVATATQASASHVLFGFREAGVPDSCLGFGNTSLTLFNMAPDDYLWVLDSRVTSGPVSLSLSCTTMNATPITCGSTVRVTTSGTSQVTNYSCLNRAQNAGEAFVALDNPARQPIAFAVSGAPSGGMNLAVFDGPFQNGGNNCLAGGNTVVRVADAPAGEYMAVLDRLSGPVTSVDVTAVCGPGTLACANPLDLTCNSVISGDTTSGTSSAILYGDVNRVYRGPETVYRFRNPVRQSVNFLLQNAPPGLDLLLLRSCDPGDLLDWNDTALIEPQLEPGDYFVVVDGLDGASGSFQLATMCGGPALDPPVLTVQLQPGTCYTETKKLYFPTTVPEGDVVFSFDLSGSMREELDQMKANVRSIYLALNSLIPSLHFGLASFVEYAQPYIDTVCNVNHNPTAPNPFPFKINQPLTPDINLVESVLQTISLVGGAKETYTRTFYEAATNPGIGWRQCSRRIWVNIGDEVPVDCNVYACIGLTNNTGRDPGPDLVTGTADDLEILPTVDLMKANNIVLIHMDSSENATQISMWSCLAQRTGGSTFVTDRNGLMPNGSDVVWGLVNVIKDTLRPCPEVSLTPTGPYASWVTVTPPAYTNVTTPFYGEFQVRFCVPTNAPVGIVDIPVEARCLGGNGCSTSLLGIQQVRVDVLEPCPVQPVANAGAAPAAICAGDSTVLDGSTSTACDPRGLRYRWLEGATVLCPWSTSPTCPITPAASTTYTLEVECVGSPLCTASDDVTVTVEPVPTAVLASPAPVCEGTPVILDAGGSAPRGCSVPLEYRFLEGAVVVRPWSPIPTYGPVPANASTTYTVQVRCTAVPGCQSSDQAPIRVEPFPAASLAPLPTLCGSGSILLDARGSNPMGCSVPIEYQFRQGASVVRPWSSSPTFGPIPVSASASYRVEVRCTAQPGCQRSAQQAFTLVPLPRALAGPDVVACVNDQVTLSGIGSTGTGCPGGLLFEWWEGSTLVRPAGPDPTFDPPTANPGTTTYRLVVRCAGLPTCEASDVVQLRLSPCVLEVHYGSYEARRDESGIVVSWTTLLERDTNLFQVERASSPQGPFAAIGTVDAHGAWLEYRLTDTGAPAGTLPWYRVVEYTSNGRGDETPPFQALEAGSGSQGAEEAGEARGGAGSRRRSGKR